MASNSGKLDGHPIASANWLLVNILTYTEELNMVSTVFDMLDEGHETRSWMLAEMRKEQPLWSLPEAVSTLMKNSIGEMLRGCN